MQLLACLWEWCYMYNILSSKSCLLSGFFLSSSLFIAGGRVFGGAVSVFLLFCLMFVLQFYHSRNQGRALHFWTSLSPSKRQWLRDTDWKFAKLFVYLYEETRLVKCRLRSFQVVSQKIPLLLLHLAFWHQEIDQYNLKKNPQKNQQDLQPMYEH